MERAKLTIIATGGTIAASSTAEGDKPTISVGYLSSQVPALEKNFDIKRIPFSQKDSTLIDHKDWIRIARLAHKESSKGRNVLILHGTDTLAYTSSALSFAIQNPQTSIVLTGSMRKLRDPETDVIKNLSDSATFLSEQLKGVYVVFNGRAMTASRTTKVSSRDPNAFETVDNRYVATIIANDVFYDNKPAESTAPMWLVDKFDNRVHTIRVTPGLPKDIFTAIVDRGFRAVNIAAFGTGNVPYTAPKNDPNKVSGGLLRRAIQVAETIPVVVTSQATHGGTELRKYAVGRKIEIPPMISGEDMTQEAAHVKLMWCLGQRMNLEQTRRAFERSYAGEITVS
jgi:L-asparaginase